MRIKLDTPEQVQLPTGPAELVEQRISVVRIDAGMNPAVIVYRQKGYYYDRKDEPKTRIGENGLPEKHKVDETVFSEHGPRESLTMSQEDFQEFSKTWDYNLKTLIDAME